MTLASRVTHLVVHCSATPHGRPVTVRDIDRWHRQRGFARIGYHYVILLDGKVDTGRAEGTPGAHVTGHNKDTIGICLVGGLDAKGKPSGDFAPVQFAALEKLLRELRERHPNAAILGHRDFPGVAKDCPCFSVREWWSRVSSSPKQGS